MSFFDFYQRFFGGRPGERPPEENYGFQRPNDSFWDSQNSGENDMRDFSSLFDFKVVTDPFEMQLFERKMNEIFRSLTSSLELPGFHGTSIFDSSPVPAIEEKQNPRSQYLKPGFNRPNPSDKDGPEDGDTKDSWLNTLVPEAPSQPHSFTSFRSVVRRSITLPDGTVKTEEIIRNSDGTEQKTESHSMPGERKPFLFDSPSLMNPDFSGLFGRFNEPEIKPTTPRNQFLKPGYEKYNPFEGKVDKDLDKEILKSGIEKLPSFNKDENIIDPQSSFLTMRSVTRKSVSLPNGVVETEEVVRNSDGSEQRTVTQTMPDGTITTTIGPRTDFNRTSENENTAVADLNKGIPSFALRGVKDLLDILFK